MRNIFLPVLFLCLLYSCGDGDLQIEAVDFDEGSIQFCDQGQDDTETTLLFKINSDETLILDLQANLIENAPSDDPILSSIPTQSNLTYRLFSDDVTQAYFCDEIPPSTPTVTEEISATGGTVQIISTLDTVSRTSKVYNHEIRILEVTLVNSQGESLTDQTGIDFGEYTTTEESSVAQFFANFEDVTINSCEDTGENTVLTKILNDEYLNLTIPTSLLANSETGETPREATLSESIIFKNGTALTTVTTDSVCAGIEAINLENEFSTTEGTVSVSTTASEPNTEGVITYTHTISLSDFALQDLNEANAGTFEEEPYVFGTFTTTSS
ncbi:hypothetical protein LV716_13375 [Flagellimonas sp. HMM57]|uniref:hypothetical protein n=1 Tax=unclassified Flagellimonas TaxID=2644544 RepID=UPI00196A0DF4|nr:MULTISPECIES: hypothetical protein [unclassified Flagellimonas]UII75244.1 hypothetical protein LV716_13375 [Flagellimonas sp. HMM57]